MASKIYNTWTLAEIIEAHSGIVYGERPTLGEYLGWRNVYAMPDITTDMEACWQSLLLRYRDEIALITDKVIDDPIESGAGDKLALGILSVYRLTTPRYGILCNLYRTQEQHLLDALKSTTSGETHSQSSSNATGGSTSKTNDTPQAAGDWASDPYTSQVSRSDNTSSGSSTGTATDERTTSTDPATIMARLDEIRTKYRDLLKDWTDEFSGLFTAAEGEDYVD